MPKPVYLICSESGSIDRGSNRISHFNIIEKLETTEQDIRTAKGKKSKPTTIMLVSLPIFVDAVWQRSEGDKPDHKFEMQFAILRPGDDDPKTIAELEFQFTNRWQRQIFQINFPPSSKAGDLTFINRIRRRGTQKWISQSYTVAVEVAPKP